MFLGNQSAPPTLEDKMSAPWAGFYDFWGQLLSAHLGPPFFFFWGGGFPYRVPSLLKDLAMLRFRVRAHD